MACTGWRDDRPAITSWIAESGEDAEDDGTHEGHRPGRHREEGRTRGQAGDGQQQAATVAEPAYDGSAAEADDDERGGEEAGVERDLGAGGAEVVLEGSEDGAEPVEEEADERERRVEPHGEVVPGEADVRPGAGARLRHQGSLRGV